MAEGLSVKPVRAITWTDVGGREAAADSALRRARRRRLRRAGQRAPAHGLPAVAEPPRRPQRGPGPLAGSVPAGLPHDPLVPRPVRAPHLDLPHRRQPGAQPAALVAAAPSRRSRCRSTSTSTITAICPSAAHDGSPDRVLGQKAARRADSRGARSSCRSIRRRPRPARDRRAELRRDRVLARDCRRHGEIAPGAGPREALRAQLRDV